MDSTPKKLYHIHGFDSRSYRETFFSDKENMIFEDDTIKFPMKNLHYVFSNGFIRGNLLIELSKGSYIHHLYSASKVFKDIITIRFSEKCAMEMRRWLGDRTGAFSWSHTTTAFGKLEGKSDQIQDRDLRLKESIKQIVMGNLEKDNLTDPLVLPLADCVISTLILECISKGEDDYMRNLEKTSNLLKIGGHLILLGVLNTTYVMVGKDRFHVFKYDESFVKSALSKLGFVIDYSSVQRRKNVSDACDYTHFIFITAHKNK